MRFLLPLLASACALLIPGHAQAGEVRDITGKDHSAAIKQAKAVVYIYTDTTCPIANFYQPTLRRLAQKYASKNVLFFQVHPDPDRTVVELESHTKDFEVVSPVILDPTQNLARLHRAKVTPEAHVYSPDGKCRYRGRIDDTYTTYGKRRPKPTTHDLDEALAAVLAGKKVATPVTKAIGCQLFIEPTPDSKAKTEE